MAFLVNFRLRSNSDKDPGEAPHTENGACAFKVKSAGSQKTFHFFHDKEFGGALPLGFLPGTWRVRAEPDESRSPRPSQPPRASPAPARAAGAHRVRPGLTAAGLRGQRRDGGLAHV